MFSLRVTRPVKFTDSSRLRLLHTLSIILFPISTSKMSESKQIENGAQVASSPVYTESEYQALVKENALLKQALDEQGGEVHSG